MTKNQQKSSAKLSKKTLFIGSFSVLVLFLGFFTNYWGVVDQHWFDTYQRDTESLIIGRIVKSGHDGIFSDGGLTGFGNLNPAPQVDIVSFFSNQYLISSQYLAYTNSFPFVAFTTYNSQIGGQGIIFDIWIN